MDTEGSGESEIVPRYAVNEKRYFQRKDSRAEDQADDDCEDQADDDLEDQLDNDFDDLLCNQFEITADTDSLCALCRSTFSEKLYKHLSCPEGRFQHHRWSQLRLCSQKGCRLCEYLVYAASGHGKSPAYNKTIVITREIETQCDTWTLGSITRRYTQGRSTTRFRTNVGNTANISIKVQIDDINKDEFDAKFGYWKYGLPIFAMKGRFFNLVLCPISDRDCR
jgi:hypothetical protein